MFSGSAKVPLEVVLVALQQAVPVIVILLVIVDVIRVVVDGDVELLTEEDHPVGMTEDPPVPVAEGQLKQPYPPQDVVFQPDGDTTSVPVAVDEAVAVESVPFSGPTSVLGCRVRVEPLLTIMVVVRLSPAAVDAVTPTVDVELLLTK